jgi:HK97 family phage major capsid protein/HK97 family phage prohead protease
MYDNLRRDNPIESVRKKGDGTLELSCASEYPVQRWFGYEILDCSPDSVNLDRMNSGAAVLVDHDTADQVGVVVKAEIKNRKLRATIRFGQSARAKEILQDILDGIRKLVSIGYRINKLVSEKVENGVETLRATDWEPYEVSLVAIPADPTVGVGRAMHSVEQQNQIMIDDKPTRREIRETLGLSQQYAEANARTEGFHEAADILAMGKQHDCEAEAINHMRRGGTLEDFRKWVLANRFNAKPVNTSGMGDIGMDRKEAKRWSLVRALDCIARQKPLDGLEREASDAVAKLSGRRPDGFFIPNEIVHGHPDDRTYQRDLAAGTGNLGGYTIQTDVAGSSLIELLRNMTVCYEFGAIKLGGLVGDVAVPAQSGAATSYWMPENGQTPSSNLTFGSLGLRPHRLSGVTALGKQLLAQSSVDVEGLVRYDLARVLAIAIDLAALAGAGNNSEPLGIINTGGIGSVTFSGAASWAKVIDFETQVANANALIGGNLGYVTSPSAKAKLKNAAKIGSTFPVFIWEDSSRSNQLAGEGKVNGYRAVATKQVPSDKMIFGNWKDLIIADWIGMDVVTDPYTLADKHQLKVTVNMLVDVGLRHATSFVVSSDSAAQ